MIETEAPICSISICWREYRMKTSFKTPFAKTAFALLFLSMALLIDAACQPTLRENQSNQAQFHTPTTQPTNTRINPTKTPTKTAPLIHDLAEQSISDWDTFALIQLDEYIRDADHTPDQIDWTISGNTELVVRHVGHSLMVVLPYVSWTGSEILTLQACDPDGLCDQADVAFTVRDENDPPQIEIADQVVYPGQPFSDLALAEHVSDEESPNDQITWELEGGEELRATLQGGDLHIELPAQDWQGRETIQLQACDPEGACSSKKIQYWILRPEDTAVTLVSNAGLLLYAGGQKIMIDAAFRSLGNYQNPPEIIEAIENAQPPFNDVDLLLVSHSHADHFDPAVVARHMQNNPKAVFVGPNSTALQIDARLEDITRGQERIHPLRVGEGESVQMDLGKIHLQAFFFSHGEGGPPNLGYLVEAGGVRFFHSGDIDPTSADLPYLQAYNLNEKNIDIALLPWFMMTEEQYHPLVLEGIQPRYIVPIHIEPDQATYRLIQGYFPNNIAFFDNLDTWVMLEE